MTTNELALKLRAIQGPMELRDLAKQCIDELTARDQEIAELREEVKEYTFLFELQKGRLDEAIAEAEKLAEAVEEIADCMGPEALPAVNDLAMMAHVALAAYRKSQSADTSPQVSADRDTKVAPEATILQEKDTHFACNWEYGPHREPMRPEWKSGCGIIHPKLISEDWHDLCPYCGKPVHVPDALGET